MTEPVVADFPATLFFSYGGEGPDEGRVLMSERRVVLATDDHRVTVPIASLFDIREGESPAGVDVSESAVTLGFQSGDDRRTATVDTDAETVSRFADLLFQEALDGTKAIVRRSIRVDGEVRQSATSRGSISVTPAGIELAHDGETVTIDPADVTEFSLESGEFDGGAEPAVCLREGGEQTVQTDLRIPSARKTNLFGRYLRDHVSRTGRDGTRRVLIVDDEPGMADMVATFVRRETDDLEAVTATGAPEGLSIVEQGVDCVVSDYAMPEMDGIDFLERVREDHPDLPFILFTGRGSESVAEAAIAAGVTDYVQKDIGTVQYAKLAERIENAIRRHG